MEHLTWLGVIRHGQSTGNVTAQSAEEGGAEQIDIPERDADVPLSDLGREQARSAGALIRDTYRPDLVVISPYLRTRQTAEEAFGTSGIPQVVDERLRDRELGWLDLLTARGVLSRLPDEARRRERLGKFYYRPPGGESWADVLLRLRAVLREIREDHPGGRVLLVAHEATVLLVRYLVEGLSEAQLMEIAHRTAVANCSLSSWRRTGVLLEPELFNAVEHLERPTKQEDVDAEPV
jgi:probable phosphoglycerate mutase